MTFRNKEGVPFQSDIVLPTPLQCRALDRKIVSLEKEIPDLNYQLKREQNIQFNENMIKKVKKLIVETEKELEKVQNYRAILFPFYAEDTKKKPAITETRANLNRSKGTELKKPISLDLEFVKTWQQFLDGALPATPPDVRPVLNTIEKGIEKGFRVWIDPKLVVDLWNQSLKKLKGKVSNKTKVIFLSPEKMVFRFPTYDDGVYDLEIPLPDHEGRLRGDDPIAMNADYLISLLKFMKNMGTVEIGIEGGLNPIKVSTETGNFFKIIMPLNIYSKEEGRSLDRATMLHETVWDDEDMESNTEELEWGKPPQRWEVEEVKAGWKDWGDQHSWQDNVRDVGSQIHYGCVVWITHQPKQQVAPIQVFSVARSSKQKGGTLVKREEAYVEEQKAKTSTELLHEIEKTRKETFNPKVTKYRMVELGYFDLQPLIAIHHVGSSIMTALKKAKAFAHEWVVDNCKVKGSRYKTVEVKVTKPTKTSAPKAPVAPPKKEKVEQVVKKVTTPKERKRIIVLATGKAIEKPKRLAKAIDREMDKWKKSYQADDPYHIPHQEGWSALSALISHLQKLHKRNTAAADKTAQWILSSLYETYVHLNTHKPPRMGKGKYWTLQTPVKEALERWVPRFGGVFEPLSSQRDAFGALKKKTTKAQPTVHVPLHIVIPSMSRAELEERKKKIDEKVEFEEGKQESWIKSFSRRGKSLVGEYALTMGGRELYKWQEAQGKVNQALKKKTTKAQPDLFEIDTIEEVYEIAKTKGLTFVSRGEENIYFKDDEGKDYYWKGYGTDLHTADEVMEQLEEEFEEDDDDWEDVFEKVEIEYSEPEKKTARSR